MTLILIDGKNCLYRFGWVHRDLHAEDGRKTGAVYGIIKLLLRLKKKYADAKFVVVWDGNHSRSGSWRRRLWSGYKANRGEPKPETMEILNQEYLARQVLGSLGIQQTWVAKVEADDLISLLATQGRMRKWKTIIYSSDQDFLQLMTDGVELIRDFDKTRKLMPETDDTVRAKFHCGAHQVLKVRSISGDPSDGVPGVVKGLGIVTAAKLIGQGIDPSYSDFKSHAVVLQMAAGKLKGVWPTVRRNYRLLYLPRHTDEGMFSDWEREKLNQAIEDVIEDLSMGSGWGNPEQRYREMVQVLASLDLQEAMEQRQEIWALQ
jgi:5'-3' exonuclease